MPGTSAVVASVVATAALRTSLLQKEARNFFMLASLLLFGGDQVECRDVSSVSTESVQLCCLFTDFEQLHQATLQRADFRQLAALQRVVAERQVDFDLFDDGAWTLAHDQQAVGQGDRFDQIVGDEERGLFLFVEHLGQILLQDHLGLRIQCRERLVHQQYLRINRQRAGQRSALAHAAGQLVGIVFFKALEVALGQQLIGHALALGGADAVDFQTERDVGADVAPWHEQVFLQHEGDVANRLGDALAADDDFTGGRQVQTRAHIQQRALAATGRADDGNHFTAANRQVDVGDRRAGLESLAVDEAFADVAKFDFDHDASWLVTYYLLL